MARKTAPLLPPTAELLRHLGERLRLARRRRRLTAKQVAERAGMSPMTLRSLERGGSGVTIGAFLAVMQVLGIEGDLDLLAQADTLGRDLQDARLPARRRTTPRTKPLVATNQRQPARRLRAPGEMRKTLESLPGEQVRKALEAAKDARDWIERGGFASSEALARLIDPLNPRR